MTSQNSIPPTTLEQRLIAICQTVRKEALDPVLQEVEVKKRQAEQEREEILRDARNQEKKILDEAEKKAAHIRKTAESSLEQASRQAVELLKEKIEKQLFNPSLHKYVETSLRSEKETASLISTLIQMIEKEGIFGAITIELGKNLSRDSIIELLGTEIFSRLHKDSITVGTHNLGIIVRIHEKQIVLDISEEAVRDLMSNFLRQEFRKMLFL